jgi:hypothetical protein
MKKIALAAVITAAMVATPALARPGQKGCPGSSNWGSFVQLIIGKLGGQAVGERARDCAQR